MTKSARMTVQSHNRREDILLKAAEFFVERGYDATTMRDIAAGAGILPGSIYYHFSSKEDLFLAVYEKGLELIQRNVQKAIDGLSDPWERLAAACVAHLEVLLGASPVAAILARPVAAGLTPFEERLLRDRNEYEDILRALTEDLPLKESVSPVMLRLLLMGGLNAVPRWYSPDGPKSPERIALDFVTMLRDSSAKN